MSEFQPWRPIRFYAAFGLSLAAVDWAKHPSCVVSGEELERRLDDGWPIERALTAPVIIESPVEPNEHDDDDSEAPEPQPKAKSSRYRGVSWHPVKRRWTARIMFAGKSTTIGYFEDEADAARAYDDRARELRGERAVLNLPAIEGPLSN